MRTLFVMLSLALLSFSCEKEDVQILPFPDSQIHLELPAIIDCNAEFDLRGENPEEWGQRVVDAVNGQGLTILSHEVVFVQVNTPIPGDNCSPSGDILRITAPVEQAEELRALGFQ